MSPPLGYQRYSYPSVMQLTPDEELLHRFIKGCGQDEGERRYAQHLVWRDHMAERLGWAYGIPTFQGTSFDHNTKTLTIRLGTFQDLDEIQALDTIVQLVEGVLKVYPQYQLHLELKTIEGEDLSLLNLNYVSIRSVLSTLQFHYPERTTNIVITNTGWVFRQVWKLISFVLDPKTVAKISMI